MPVAHLESVDDVDAWDGYEANRRRVLDTISENKIDNVIVISGDSQ
jgi:alkaline phosphatase D